eukprot:322148_1
MGTSYFWVYHIFIICVFSTTFDCSKDEQCKNQNLACDDGVDCFIYCTRYQSCYGTKFTCPKSNGPNMNVSCNVVCGDGTTISADSCTITQVNAYYSDFLSLTVNGVDGQLISNGMKITCPCEGKCDIDCDSTQNGCQYMTVNVEKSELNMQATGDRAYRFMTVRGEYASKLTMTGSGPFSFFGTNIYCPNSENDGPIKCHLRYIGDDRGFYGATISAIDSFWDLDMICDGADGFSEGQCYGSTMPTMYCLSDYSQSCTMITNDGINWECTDSTAVCAVAQTNQQYLETYECPTGSANEGISVTLIIIVVITACVIFIIIGALLFWKKKKYKQPNLGENKQNYQSLDPENNKVTEMIS